MILDARVKDNQGGLLEEVRQAFQASAQHGQWLVLAENEPAVLRRLNEMLGEQALILAFDWRDSVALIDAVRSEFGEKCRLSSEVQLALVGSSRWGTERERNSPNCTDEAAATAVEGREFERWVAGASRMQRQLQQSKRQFAGLVHMFVEKMQEELSPVVLDGKLQTLFYHAEAGMFLEYDWRQWQFRPVN